MAAKKAKKTAIKDKYTKSAILAELAETTDLSKKQVSSVLDELSSLIERHVKKGGAGEFTLPGLLKIKTVKKPSRPARKGVPNPFRPGELMDVAAKPASTKIKVLPLKGLKEFVQSTTLIELKKAADCGLFYGAESTVFMGTQHWYSGLNDAAFTLNQPCLGSNRPNLD